MTQTGNTLDVAVIGNTTGNSLTLGGTAATGGTWMGFSGPAGTVYTRDGRMQISNTGELQTVTGFPVLDAGGSPILVDPDAGPLTIGRNGTISQGINQVGVLGLFNIPADAKLERFANSGVIPDRAATTVIDFAYAGFQQGYVEGSNVDPLAGNDATDDRDTRLPECQRGHRGLRGHDAECHSLAWRTVKVIMAGNRT